MESELKEELAECYDLLARALRYALVTVHRIKEPGYSEAKFFEALEKLYERLDGDKSCVESDEHTSRSLTHFLTCSPA